MATYDRNLPRSKFFTTSRIGSGKYNPQITLYYNAADDLIKVKEEFANEIWQQTISGTGISQTVVKTVIYDPWTKV